MTQVLANTDSYKLSHKGFMEKGTTKIYSNLTARSSKYFPVIKDRFNDKVVMFGLQYFIKEYLIGEWNTSFFEQPKDQVIPKFKRLIDAYLGAGSVPMDHFEKLHDLGYLPIQIKAIEEGCRVNIKVPLLTITNTHEDFAWLTNYLETVMSCELWKPITTATIIYEYRKLVNEFALKTTGSLGFSEFQVHDFSFRGMSGRHDAAINSAGFLLSSCGTDSIPAIQLLEDYYGADCTKEFIATSVPASEHSIQCAGTEVRGEFESFKKWITEDYPTGIVSLVSDGFDYWKVLTDYLPRLKDDVLNRQVNELGLSKVVIRPDSGNPVDIICGFKYLEVASTDVDFDSVDAYLFCGYQKGSKGEYQVIKINDRYYIPQLNFHTKENGDIEDAYIESLGLELSEAEVKGSVEVLWEIFGGTVTEQGYKILDNHIGLIYGDSITLTIAQEIFKRLEDKGFASTNVVLGVGSYTMQYLTRDSLGMAVKATYTEVDGVGYELFKDPVTDNGVKKSAKGLLRVEKDNEGNFILHDQQTIDQEQQGLLQTVFINGKLAKETTLTEIRNKLWS